MTTSKWNSVLKMMVIVLSIGIAYVEFMYALSHLLRGVSVV